MKIILLSIVLILSFGFINIKNNESKQEINLLCSKTWIPLNNGVPDSLININYFLDHTYKLKISPKNGFNDSGDAILKGIWTIDENKYINLSIGEIKKTLKVLKLENNLLIVSTGLADEPLQYISK